VGERNKEEEKDRGDFDFAILLLERIDSISLELGEVRRVEELD